MTDFKEMVRKAKIEAEAQASAGARTSSKQWNDEIAVLREKVMPILKRACADFGTEDVYCLIQPRFEHVQKPRVYFRLVGAGGQISVPLRFEINWIDIYSYVEGRKPDPQSGAVEKAEDVISNALNEALKIYWGTLHRLRPSNSNTFIRCPVAAETPLT